MKHNRKLQDQLENSEAFEGGIDIATQVPAGRRSMQHRNGIVAFMADFVASHRPEDVAPGTRDFLKSAANIFRKDK